MGVERGSAGQEFSGEDKGPSHCDTTVSIRSLRPAMSLWDFSLMSLDGAEFK